MIELFIKRTVLAVPTLILVSIIMFVVLFLGPNPLDALTQNPNFTPKDVKRITHQLGWDKPWPVQYMNWAKGFVQGDMGTSISTMRPAKEMISERLPLTLLLTGMALVISISIAIPIGAYIAVKRYSAADYAATFMTFAMMASPSFFFGLLLQLTALFLQDATGGTLVFFTAGAPACVSHVTSCPADIVDVVRHMALPVAVLSMLQIAGWSRYQRSELLGVLDSEFVKAAMAKGITWRRVFFAHALRNALMPIITIVAMDVAFLFGGAVITESVFGLPGMGTLLLDSVTGRDVVVVLDIVMLGTVLVLVFNTIADLAYGLLDPRVRVK